MIFFGSKNVQIKERIITAKVYYAIPIVLLLIGLSTSYAQETTIIEIKNFQGDIVDPSGIELILEDKNTNEKSKINLDSNPYLIDKDKIRDKRIQVFNNGMFANHAIPQSDPEKISITIPNQGGISFEVYYENGSTPIDGAKIILKSPDGTIWAQDITNHLGESKRIWLQSTTKDSARYEVEIMQNGMLYEKNDIYVPNGITQDYKINVSWPKIINSAITFSVYDEKNKITKYNGKLIIEISNDSIQSKPVSIHGDAVFSNLESGIYNVKVIATPFNQTESQIWSETNIILTGKNNQIKLSKESLLDSAKSCNCVAFRFDDVQDYFLNEVQKQIIELFASKNASMTIGIIGGLIGEDPIITEYIKTKLASGYELEIANHAWSDARMPQFDLLGQEKIIKDTNEKIKSIFNYSPQVFIPPGNMFDENTITVLQQNNMTHLSSHLDNDQGPYVIENSTFYKFPASSETAIFVAEESRWLAQEKEKIFQTIQNEIQSKGFAVVMMHPYEFSGTENGLYNNKINQEIFQDLSELIDDVRSSGIDIVPIGQINLDSEPYAFIPPEPQVEIEPEIITSEIESVSCNCVSFRLDGLQDFWLNDVQIKLLETFLDQKIPLTVGVIANSFGSDSKMIQFFNSTDIETIEFANNGWTYVDFTSMSYQTQKTHLLNANAKLLSLFDKKPTTFLAPFDRVNENTLRALKETNMNTLSSRIYSDTLPLDAKKFELNDFSSAAHTAIYDVSAGAMVGISHEETFDMILSNMESNGFSVVTLNIQDFATFDGEQYQNKINQKQFDELNLLIEKLELVGYDLVKINEIPKKFESSSIPIWIKNNAKWWSQGIITDVDFASGLEFLIKEDIVKVSNHSQQKTLEEPEIPSWVRSNAEWWADGLIEDVDFVSGIEHLIKIGVIST